jgi:2'-5' RNA ligase
VSDGPRSQHRDPTLRLFFALVPGAGVRASLAALGESMRACIGGRVTAAENLHLTLAFLGAIPAEALPALVAIGRSLPQDGFALSLDRVGVFKAPGIAWVAPRIAPAPLLALANGLTGALQDAGFALDARPFRPHVTLARRARGSLARFAFEPIVWPVETVALVESVLSQQGARYSERARWALVT